MKRVLILSILISLLLSSCGGREEVVIKGKVTDSLGNPLMGVKVEIVDLNLSQTTDRDGSFTFKDSFEEKTYTLRFEKEGFKTIEKKVDAVKGENSVDVSLDYTTFEKIVRKRVIVIGMDLNDKPFSFIECSKKEGFEVDLIREITKRMSISPFIVNIPKNDLFKALIDEDVDIAISSITPEKIKGISFSKPYFIDGYAIVIRNREWRIKSYKDLKGKVVEVTEKKLLKKIKELFPEVRRVEYEKNLEKAMADLDEVLVDAVISPYSSSAYYCKRYRKVKMIDEIFDEKIYSIACRSSDKELIEKINDILTDMFKDGTYEKIFNKWFYPLDSTKIVIYNDKKK